MRGRWLPAVPFGRRGLVLTLALAVSLVLSAAPEPLASGPRPAVSTWLRPSDAWSPPAPWVDHRFTTLPYETVDGVPGTWTLTDQALSLELTLERELVDRFGLDALRTALEVWNDTDGSRFGVDVRYLTDDGADARRRDGVNRVFLDRTSCEDRYLARAHLFPAAVEIRDGRSVAWVEEVDIGLCERLQPDRLASVLRHEIAHVAGLGHLCDAGSDCWEPEMSPDNRCRVMSPASYGCQEPTAGDRDGLVYMHPVVPRVGGRGALATAGAVARVSHPVPQRAAEVVLLAADDDRDLQSAAAVLAARRDAPLVLVDEDCTTGEDGEAINRTASVAARALLVGAVSRACEDSLSVGWELETERLPDIGAVAEATIGDEPPLRVVVVPRHDPADARVPVSTLAVPVAARLDAVLVPVDVEGDGLDRGAEALLERAPDATVAIIVGGPRFVGSDVEAELVARGLRIRRIPANERTRLAIAVSRMRDVFGRDPIGAVLVPAEPHGTLAPAAALAARERSAILPVSEARHRQVLDPLRDRIDHALLVGDVTEVSVDLHLALSRLVDG